MEEENWKDIGGYEGYYMVSNKGRIKSISRTITTKNGLRRKIKQSIRVPVKAHGYHCITFSKNNKWKKFQIHRLVALTFIENLHNKSCVNHINGVKTDNRVENLEWVTHSENERHSYDVLGKVSPSKEHVSKKVYQYDVNGKFIKEYLSATECALFFNVSPSCIGQDCKNKNRVTRTGYKFSYKKLH